MATLTLGHRTCIAFRRCWCSGLRTGGARIPSALFLYTRSLFAYIIFSSTSSVLLYKLMTIVIRVTCTSKENESPRTRQTLFEAKRTRAPPPDFRFVVRMLNTHLAFDSYCINVNYHIA